MAEPDSLYDCLPAPEVPCEGVTAEGMASAELPLLGVAEHKCPKRLEALEMPLTGVAQSLSLRCLVVALVVFLTGVAQCLSLDCLVVAPEGTLLGVAEALLLPEDLVVTPRPLGLSLCPLPSLPLSDRSDESGKGSLWRRLATTFAR